MRLTNPIEYMTRFTHKIVTVTNIIITLKDYFYGSLGFFPTNFNIGVNTPKIWLIDTRLFFRTTNLIIFIF